MCESVELDIVRLCRVAIGNLKLGDLAPGKWRHLSASMVDYLRTADKTKKNDQSKERK
jgi:16S rRNA U516 pseudouridylate synthase RsuA-like enzyme